MLSELAKLLDAPVVAYVGNMNHPVSWLVQADIPLFMDLLQVAAKTSKKVYMILQSPGGDGDTAEKILGLFRSSFPQGFNVIIPQFAKSAATMISIGTDKIVMSDPSELGPIDPQIQVPLPSGQMQFVPAKAFVGVIDEISEKIKKDPAILSTYYPLLQQIKPEMIKQCEDSLVFSRDFAKRWLPVGAMRGKTPAEIEAAKKELIEGNRYILHGNVINYTEARDTLKLNVDYWPMSDKKWQLLWEYFLRVIPFFGQDGAKLFETTETSTLMNIQLVHSPQPK